jgi:hypothetical protein
MKENQEQLIYKMKSFIESVEKNIPKMYEYVEFLIDLELETEKLNPDNLEEYLGPEYYSRYQRLVLLGQTGFY